MAQTEASSHNPLVHKLSRIPLPVRMLAYAAAFLAVMLVALPWLAFRLDVALPTWRVEVGIPLRTLGWLIFGVSLALYLYASYLLSARGRGAYVEFDPPAEFVASGPFRYARNPIAGSLVVCFLGLALAYSSTGIALLFLIAIPLAHLQVIWLEEPLLERRFGQAYRTYMRTTPRWLPRLTAKQR